MKTMRKTFLFLMCVSISLVIYAQEEASSPFRDPFDPAIPQEKGPPGPPKGPQGEDVITPPEVTIEGVLWGTDKPQAIIDGEVYKEGDTLKTVDAQVFRIENNTVFIRHKGKVFEFGVKSKGVGVKIK